MPESRELGGEPPAQEQHEREIKPLTFYTETSRREDPEHQGKKLPRRFLTEQELSSLEEGERKVFTEITIDEADRDRWMMLQELHDTTRDYRDSDTLPGIPPPIPDDLPLEGREGYSKGMESGFRYGVDAMMSAIAQKMNSLEKKRRLLKYEDREKDPYLRWDDV